MTMYLRRRAQFSASSLHPQIGGHNYVVELTVGGPIDPLTGMVVNIRDVDALLKKHIVQPWHGTVLERDVAPFKETLPTPESLVRRIWDVCSPALPSPSELVRVTLWPTPTLWVDLSTLDPLAPLRKGTIPMLTLTRAYDFSASHRLHSRHLSDAENAEIFGKCNWANGHGHNYEVEVTLAGEPDVKTGLLLPPETLDEIVESEVLRPYDHRHLNYDTHDFRDLNPTSENLTRVIWDRLAPCLPLHGQARLYRVVVRETARNYFEYYGG